MRILEMKDKYSMVVHWSEADSRYLAFVPELPGCIADGETLEEATQELVLALKDWLETAKELGMDIPPAVSREVAVKQKIALSRKQQQEIQQQIEKSVQEFAERFQEGLAAGVAETLRENLFENDEWRKRLLSVWAKAGKLVESNCGGDWAARVTIRSEGRRVVAPR